MEKRKYVVAIDPENTELSISSVLRQRLKVILKTHIDDEITLSNVFNEVINTVENLEMVVDKTRSTVIKELLNKYLSDNKEINNIIRSLNDIVLSTDPGITGIEEIH